jgi:MFS family permease
MAGQQVTKKGRGLTRALKHRDFRLLLGGQSVSGTGDWLFSTALVIFVFEQTHSAGWVSAACIMRLLPSLLFGALGGVIADRFDRRRVMIASDLIRFGLMVVATVLATDGSRAAVAGVIGVAFFGSVASSAFYPAMTALIPSMVGEDDLAPANGLTSVVDNLTLALGPALGGVILLVAGSASTAFAINGVTFLVSAAAVALMRVPGTDGQVEVDSGLRERIAAGINGVTSSADALLLTLLTVAFTLAFGTEVVVFAPVSSQLLGTSAAGASWLFAAPGVAGLFAAGLAGRLAERPRTATILVWATLLAGIPLLSLSVIRSPWLAYGMLLLEGVAVVISDVVAITTLQRVVDRSVLGSVIGILETFSVAGILLGSLLAPLWIAWFGLPAACAIGGAMPIVISLVAAPKARAMNRIAAERAAALAVRVSLIRAAPMLDGLSTAGLESLAAAAVEQGAAAGADVLIEGEMADDLYVVASGTLDVLSAGVTGGQPKLVGRLAAGDVFGEIGVLRGIPRTATVRASEASELYRIAGSAFLEAVSEAPAVSRVLHSTASLRLALTDPTMSAEGQGA